MSGENGRSDNEIKTYRSQVEANLAKRFLTAMEQRAKQLEVSHAQDFKLSNRERKVLMDVVVPNVLQGSIAGIVTFVLLRRFHSKYFQFFKGRASNNNATHQSNTTGTRGPTTMPSAFNSPYQQIPIKPTAVETVTGGTSAGSSSSTSSGSDSFGTVRSIYNSLSFVVDGILAVYVAFYVSSGNPDKVLQQLGELPLMEGTSTVSQELCPVFVQELQKIHYELAETSSHQKISNNNKEFVRDAIADPQSPLLQCLLSFSTNCRRRSAYEQLLREESGSSDGTVISIPAPGVPATFDVTNDTSTSTTESIFDDSNLDDDSTTNMSSDWTEPFVTDQEEERRKK